MCKLILASGSSRRHSLLNQLNLAYSVLVPNVDESIVHGEIAATYVCRMARTKALAVFKKSSTKHVVLAADTVISWHTEIIGKPEDALQAKNILQKLSASEHQVLTAVCLKTQQDIFETMVATKVKFRKIADSEIDTYCLTSEPYDKAGAYAIQGLASSFVEFICGSYTNVMGLPLTSVCDLLVQANLYDVDDE